MAGKVVQIGLGPNREDTRLKIRPLKDRDRSIELEEALDKIVLRATDRLNAAGFSTKEVLEALNNVVLARWKAYDEDPDPAEDP